MKSLDGYIAIQLPNIQPDTKLEFNLYLYLSHSNRIILYRKSGQTLDVEKIKKLKQNFFNQAKALVDKELPELKEKEKALQGKGLTIITGLTIQDRERLLKQRMGLLFIVMIIGLWLYFYYAHKVKHMRYLRSRK